MVQVLTSQYLCLPFSDRVLERIRLEQRGSLAPSEDVLRRLRPSLQNVLRAPGEIMYLATPSFYIFYWSVDGFLVLPFGLSLICPNKLLLVYWEFRILNFGLALFSRCVFLSLFWNWIDLLNFEDFGSFLFLRLLTTEFLIFTGVLALDPGSLPNLDPNPDPHQYF